MNCNTLTNNSKRHSSVRSPTTEPTDLLTQLFNKKIINSIESYYRCSTSQHKDVLKYLFYFYKKWDGNIQIPIRNLCKRFNLCARRVHTIIKELYDMGWLITIACGYGRKITRRTITQRGLIVVKSLISSAKISKQDINRKSADYCADYSGVHTNYISSKVDKLQKPEPLQATENQKKDIPEGYLALRRMLNERQNR